MPDNRKKRARQRQLRNRTILFFVITAIIACVIIVMAVKKGNLRKEDDKKTNNKEVAEHTDDKSEEDNKEDANSTDTVSSEDTTQPEDLSGNDISEQPEDDKNYLKYVNSETPDLSSKGKDQYDSSIYVPANVTDDAYFDTALLIGDSRTEGLGLYCGLANLDIIAAKGLTIDNVMKEDIAKTSKGDACTIEKALEDKKYDNIYISFGLNELGWAYYELFTDYYKTMIETIHNIQPDAVIYIENVLPVSAALSEQDSVYNNPNVDKLNGMIEDMCKAYDYVIYLDVASSVKEDGVLPADASSDGRHCNVEYCNKWMDYIRNNVYIKK